MEDLTGLDTSFLTMETDGEHMHVAGLYVFEAPDDPTTDLLAVLRAQLEQRLHLVPRYRQRVQTMPLGIDHPVWVDDVRFDIERHVIGHVLPDPGGHAELIALCERLHAQQLDRRRPLWEVHLVTGLEGGRFATFSKTHHAVLDGMGGNDVTKVLLDQERRPAPIDAPPWTPEPSPSTSDLVARSVRRALGRPATARRLLGDGVHMGRAVLGRSASPRVARGRRTSLNGSVGASRSYAVASVELDRLKIVKKELGGTINDVVLAMCSGALRGELKARGDTTTRRVSAFVPVSVRQDGDDINNHISGMLVELPVEIADPLMRYRTACSAAERSKAQLGAMRPGTLADAADLVPPVVARPLAQLAHRSGVRELLPPAVNVTVSNVPGPREPLYAAGCELVEYYPCPPINDGASLNITCLSYADRMYFGVTGDRRRLPDAQRLVDRLVEELDELANLSPTTA
ncbi:MAG: wax ester/triacylglycerol synthase family O-acyltransferase [Actinomycetota bacterium]